MQNIGLLISTWEYDLIKTKKFWHKLINLIAEKKINAIGFPLLSPYGLTYPSKNLGRYVYLKDFTELFVDGIKRLKKVSPQFDLYVWYSILYNTFLPNHLHQQNFEGKLNPEYICPNKNEVRQEIKKIFDDSLNQQYMNSISELSPKFYLLLDGMHFFDVDYCGCDECASMFKQRNNIDESLFQRFKKKLTIEPTLFRKWVDFKGQSIVDFFNTIIHDTHFAPDRISISYSGFADETSILAGDIKRGCLFDEFIKIRANQILVKGAERWLFDPEILDDLRLVIPFWRDIVLDEGKDFALKFHGHLLPNQILTIVKLAQTCGISKVFLSPLSKAGIESIFRYLS